MNYSAMEHKASWQPISKGALIVWLIAYGLFMVHAVRSEDGFLVLDHINLPFHEAGHIFFNPLEKIAKIGTKIGVRS